MSAHNGSFRFAVACNIDIDRKVVEAIRYAAKQGVTLAKISEWVRWEASPATVSKILRASRLQKPVMGARMARQRGVTKAELNKLHSELDALRRSIWRRGVQ